MLTIADTAWLAGLLDGEGCIAFMRRTDYAPKHRLEVRYDVKIAMACKDTIMRVGEMIASIVGDDLVKVFEERRRIARRRPLWRCEVSSKRGVHDLLVTLLPHLFTKQLEARLVLRYLDRALAEKRYKADDHDRFLADLATGIRNGCGEARSEAKELLGQVIPSQAVCEPREGKMTEGVETSGQAFDGPRHECPAPSLRNGATGEEIVRSHAKA
jgi:hypothetical protein